MDTRHTLYPTGRASVSCRSLDEEYQSLLKMLQTAVHEHERVFSQRHPGLESYKFAEEKPKSLTSFYIDILKLKTWVRKLSAEIACVEQPIVNIKIFLSCPITTCELLGNAFDDLYEQLCGVDRQITLAYVKAIACSGRPGAMSLEEQIQQFSSLFSPMFVQTSKITEILKILLRETTQIETIVRLYTSSK
ncbi:uncharacterized protein C8R40DRAFT_1169677 [Lentinula edodes]|uniref:uncharacterized protein n=1 Tax=Lentinula edodes TaxID=5353 RepID=UPI001E8D3C79|nr:uncharacterized protein C8R40DRAFT_1169677 [Lentinula edodes]KAH7876023.1 hypothetical protein C8R40DRAFT_1169677 [Lentinula edodes]